MKRMAWFSLPAVAALMLLWAQEPEPEQKGPARLPNGKLQIDEILKDDHRRSQQDVERIRKLADEVKADLEKNDSHVLSVAALRKVEEIEKLARRIRGRIRRY